MTGFRRKVPIRVAIVEDQGGLRDSLREILGGSEGITCVAACVNAEQAVAELPPPGTAPDLPV